MWRLRILRKNQNPRTREHGRATASELGGKSTMQCPFLSLGNKRPFCETGAFGLMAPKPGDYRKFCTNRSYYMCQVYRANTGTGDKEKCLQEIAPRLVQA